MKNFIIGIPKGRILKDSFYFLKKNNIKIFFNKNTRKLYFRTNIKNIFIITIKNSDSLKYLKNNLINILITGKDIILNSELNIFYKYFKINYFKINFSIISNKFFLKNLLEKNKNIKTKYKKLVKFYLKYKNIKYKIEKLNGSLELIPLLNKDNFIFDITESESTIIDNKIYNLNNIINIEPILVINFDVIYKNLLLNFFTFLIKSLNI